MADSLHESFILYLIDYPFINAELRFMLLRWIPLA